MSVCTISIVNDDIETCSCFVPMSFSPPVFDHLQISCAVAR